MAENKTDLVSEIEDLLDVRHFEYVRRYEASKLLGVLQRARDALELNRLEKKVLTAMAMKFNINSYGTDKQCKEAFKKLWTAFDELEAYENDRERNTESDTLDCS